MTIRLHGTRDEVAEVAVVLLKVLRVVTVTGPYPDRPPSRLVRTYVEIRL